MEARFLGAAGEVTGSCCLLKVAGMQLLLDCGLVQGSRRAEARNALPFEFDPTRIDAVVLSHAHIDHSGRLPLLVRRGYRGPIYTHRATHGLCRVLLPDSASLSRRDAEQESRRRARKGLPPVEPLYSAEDVETTLRQFRSMDYDEWRELLPGVRLRLREAGHILGAASLELELEEDGLRRTLVYSGDLGSYEMPIVRDPASIAHADALIMESTYGDRDHRSHEATLAELEQIIASASHDQGNIIIPAFAVGRTQDLLYLFGKHWQEWGLARWKIYLDSPMAIQASQLYISHTELHDEETQALAGDRTFMPPLPNLVLCRTPEESMRLNGVRSGAIIIAGSGMCNGGRVVHHLKHNVWRASCHVVIVGYQASGTLGRRLVDGLPWVRIHGEAIRVEARVHTVGGMSAHAGQRELLRWYGNFEPPPPAWLIHGEPKARSALAEKLAADFGSRVTQPEPGEGIDLVTLEALEP
jgi:metallo-beta-lactamase family protein